MSFLSKVEAGKFLSSEDALKKQAKAMTTFALTLPAGSARAQCYTIANYKLDGGETIAERLRRDHSSASSALRAAQLMVDAGCASEVKNKKSHLFGTFIFLDGSELG